MNRLLAAIGALVALSACEVLTLSRTTVSHGWTILAAAVSLVLMVVTLSSASKHRALVGSLLVGAVPPALVVTTAGLVPMRVVLPAACLLAAGELAAFSRDQISVVADAGGDAAPRLVEIGALVGTAGMAALAVGLVGRLDLGTSPVLVALGASAIAALVFVLVPGRPADPD